MARTKKLEKQLKNDEKRPDIAGAKIGTAEARIERTEKGYKVSIFLGRIKGKVKHHTATAKTRAEANRLKKDMEAHRAELLQAAITRPDAEQAAGPRLKAAIKAYLHEGVWSPKTAAAKRYTLEHYLLDRIGDKPIAGIDGETLKALRTGLLQNGLAENTVAGIMRTIKAFFARAVKEKKLQENPAAGLQALKTRPAPRKFWDAGQVKTALCGPLWLRLLLATSIRPEELQALRWDAVDWKRGAIKIERVAYYARGRWQARDGAKSGSSIRVIPIDGSTLQALQDAYTAAEQPAAGYVIPAPRGGIIPLNTLRLWLRTYCAAQGLPEIPLYSLRHSSITYLLEAGAPLKAVSARAGHASPTITLQRYAQITDAAAQHCAALFDTAAPPAAAVSAPAAQQA